MSKDHVPSDFGRPSGYKSDLEIAETGANVKSVNTSFGSKNHNAYIMRNDKTHEHFYYDPKSQKSGWHGHNYATKNNHPQLNKENSVEKGETNMERSNEFIERIKVDKATVERCNEVSRNAANKTNVKNSKSQNEGGRERGDSGPLSHGRESGYKTGETTAAHEGNGNGHSDGNGGNSGHGAGQGSGGHSGGNGGNSGHGGSGGGQGGSGGGH